MISSAPPLATQPSVSWSIAAGGLGTISNTGLYTAPTSGVGSATVRAASGQINGSVKVSVVAKDTATFLKQDATTKGNWIGTYGTLGYDVIDDPASLPSYAVITPSGESNSIWTSNTTDVRALRNPGGSGRIAACWYSGSKFKVDVNLSDGQVHDLELYLVDWDSTSRAETVTISDAVTGAVLSTQSVSSFNGGVYLNYAVSGHVVITFTRTAGANVVLSGLFLDPATSGPTATFLKQDATTKGNWIGTYGTLGYDVIDDPASLPSYAVITPSGESNSIWTSNTTDVRALRNPGGIRPHRRLLVLWLEIQSGRQPDRRPGARSGAIPGRLGFNQPRRDGDDQQRGHRRRALDAVGLVVQWGGVPQLRGQRARGDHLHAHGRGKRGA